MVTECLESVSPIKNLKAQAEDVLTDPEKISKLRDLFHNSLNPQTNSYSFENCKICDDITTTAALLTYITYDGEESCINHFSEKSTDISLRSVLNAFMCCSSIKKEHIRFSNNKGTIFIHGNGYTDTKIERIENLELSESIMVIDLM
jgi:hypothetical protein